jgi:hypothetical protein
VFKTQRRKRVDRSSVVNDLLREDIKLAGAIELQIIFTSAMISN